MEVIMDLSQVKVGDAIAFVGTDPISKLIRIVSQYSHVAIVNSTDPLTIVESTTDISLADDGKHKVVKGVQEHELDKRIAAYHGEAWLAPLKEPLKDDAQAKMLKWLMEEYVADTGYDFHGVMGLGLELVLGLNLHQHANFHKVFCSEYVTRALQVAGIVDSSIDPIKQTPEMVTKFPCYGLIMPLKS